MIEHTILRNLLTNEPFMRKTIPFLRSEYFHDAVQRTVYEEISSFVEKYNQCPTQESLSIDLSKKKLSDEIFKGSVGLINELTPEEPATDLQWLCDQTEQFCQDKAVYNSIMKSIEIFDGKAKEDKGAIPQLLSDALSVSFDPNIGHDYVKDSEARYEWYHKKETKIEFDLDYFNKITDGGLPDKTLNIVMAGTGVGKSLFMCHCAASNMYAGKNVLYISMEMAEERIAERIDANLLDIPIHQLREIPRDVYDKKIASLRSTVKGKLIVKEYPTASAHVGHFRHLVNELKIKRNIRPDIIYVDYLNICASARMKGNATNLYQLVKSIAEELRGFAVEIEVPIVSATQVNRSGFMSSDMDLGDTSESFGLPATADFFVGIQTSDELEEKGLLLVKQLKNRYNDPSQHKRFVIGVERSKMRLFDVQDQSQVNNPQKSKEKEQDDKPAFDRGTDNRMTDKREFGNWNF